MPSVLQGRRVLVTRPQAQSAGLITALEARGAIAIALPLYRVEDWGEPSEHERRLRESREFEGWIFTSANAARRCAELDTAPAHLPWPRLYAVGAATARALEDGGHPGALTSGAGSTSEDLLGLPSLQDVRGHRLLICTGLGGRDVLATTLAARGAHVERLELYRRLAIDHPPERVAAAADAAEAVLVTSGEGLQRLYQLTPPESRPHLLAAPLVVPSARVLEQAQRLGFAAARAPTEMSDAALLACLERGLASAIPRSMTDPVPADAPSPSDPAASGALPPSAAAQATRPVTLRAPGRAAPLRLLAGVVLLLILAAMGGSAWLLWQEREALGLQLQQRAAQLDRLGARTETVESRLGEIGTHQSDLSRQADRNGTEIAALQARTEESFALMSRIGQELSGGRARFQLASIEQLLLLASDRLLLQRDVASALVAMDIADGRLAALSDPALFPIREALAQERTALRAVPRADLASATLSLSSLIENVPRLPLVAHAPTHFSSPAARGSGAAAAGPASNGGWERLWASVRETLASLVTLRRDDNSQALRMLPPETEAVVYQVLVLKLESARVALLRGDTVAMRESMRSVSTWLDQQFRPDDPGVLAARSELERLQQLDLSPPLPETGRALSLLREQLASPQ